MARQNESLHFAFLVIIIVTVIGTVHSKRRYDGYIVIGATPINLQQLHLLKALHTEGLFDLDIEFWKSPRAIGATSDIQVSPDSRQLFEGFLSGQNISYTIHIKDLQKVIDEQDDKYTRPKGIRYRDPGNYFNLGQYHSYDQISGYLFNLANLNPSKIRVESIGTTHERRPIYMLRISNGNLHGSQSRPAIWIDGGIHAREWVSPATVLYFIDQLSKGFDSFADAKSRSYSNNIDWFIVPVLNPDGYQYSRDYDRMWRKNRSPEKCSRSRFRKGQKCCAGTDLNRNYDARFSEFGASGNPCSEIYHGSRAFSEPETDAVRKIVMQNKNNLKSFLTLHSYSQMWFYPYGYEERTYPADVKVLKKLAKDVVKAIRSKDGTVYEYGTGADLLYSASGGAEDWAKETAGIKYSYLVELRPDDSIWGNGFVLPENQILPTAEETWEGVKVVADQVLSDAGLGAPDLSKRPPSDPVTTSLFSNDCEDQTKRCDWLKRWQGCERSLNIRKLCPKSCNDCV